MADIDPFGNSGINSTQIGANPNQSPIPGGAGSSGNPLVDQLVQHLAQTAQLQRKVVMPQQLPPQHVQAGDVSGNFVNPSTSGGPAHNARVSMAQAIGQAAAQAVNRHEDKEARDLAFDIQLMESNMNTLNDPSATPQEKQMAQQQLNSLTSDKAKMKKIQKALNIQFFGGEDKRTGVEKKAVKMAQIGSQSQGGQNGQSQSGQKPMAETNGIPDNLRGLNPMAQQLMQRLPTQPGLSPSAQTTAELVKSGVLPSASDIMKYASDQQYYKVMEDKMGVEAASKLAAIQEKAQADYNRMSVELIKLSDEKAIAEKKAEISEMLHKATEGIQNERNQILKDQLDERRDARYDRDDITKDKNTIDRLGKQSKSLNDQVLQLQKAKTAAQKIASTGVFASKKQKDAAKDIEDIDKRIKDLQTKQQSVNDKLEQYNTGDTSSTPTDDPNAAEYNKLIQKYSQPTSQTAQPRQTL